MAKKNISQVSRELIEERRRVHEREQIQKKKKGAGNMKAKKLLKRKMGGRGEREPLN